MNRIAIGAANPYQSIPDPESVLQHIYKILSTLDPHTANTINPQGDTEIQYPYSIYDASFEQAGDDQRSEGIYLDIEFYDRSASYANLWQYERDFRQVLDKARIPFKDYFFMIKWNRSNQIPTEQAGLLRIAAQYYIKAESRSKHG